MKKNILKNIILILVMFLLIFSIIITKPLIDLDEIWNYNFARNVVNGLIPYKDFNMITMPLLPLIIGFILKITINQLIIMRIIAAISCTLILFFIYKIFRLLKINNRLIILFLFAIGYIYHDILCIDYNWMSLFFVLFIIYYEIKLYITNKEPLYSNIKNDIFLGVLAGITFLFKQTSGAIICFVLLVNKLIDVKCKENFKLYLKIFVFRLIGILIPVSFALMYLLFNNAFNDFINYTFKGASSFTNFISYNRLFKFNITGLLAITVPVLLVYELYRIVIKGKDKQLYYIFIYGLAIFIIAFPISDKIHFIIGATPFIIILFFELARFIEKIVIKNREKFNKIFYRVIFIINIILAIVVTIFGIRNYSNYVKSNHSELNNYKYIPINKDSEEAIKLVDNYIITNNKDIKILDSSAALYMIPINKYNKDYDMFNKGNFGENGENRLIEDIDKSKNRQYLLLKDKYRLNWQTPTNIIKYVKENKNRIGEISIFDIYE